MKTFKDNLKECLRAFMQPWCGGEQSGVKMAEDKKSALAEGKRQKRKWRQISQAPAVIACPVCSCTFQDHIGEKALNINVNSGHHYITLDELYYTLLSLYLTLYLYTSRSLYITIYLYTLISIYINIYLYTLRSLYITTYLYLLLSLYITIYLYKLQYLYLTLFIPNNIYTLPSLYLTIFIPYYLCEEF